MGAWIGKSTAFNTIGGGAITFDDILADTSADVEEAPGVDPTYVEILTERSYNVSIYIDYEVTSDGNIVVELWHHDGASTLLFTETIAGVTGVTDDYTYGYADTIEVGYLQVVLAASSTATGDVNANAVLRIIEDDNPPNPWTVGRVSFGDRGAWH